MTQVRADYRQIRVPQTPTIFQHVGGIASYPAPKEGVWPKVLVPHRPLLGLLPPPADTARPEPERVPLPPPPEGWVRTHHAAPAAYPRLYREGHGTLGRSSQPWGEVPADESREQRQARLDGWCETLVRDRYDAHAWSLEEAQAAAPPKQWISVERWAREGPVGGYTLVCTHAGGLQKEVSARPSAHELTRSTGRRSSATSSATAARPRRRSAAGRSARPGPRCRLTRSG